MNPGARPFFKCQCSASGNQSGKISIKNIALVAVAGWMLFPDQRVTCGDVKIIPICRDKGPDPEVWTNKDGLDIYHGRLSIAVWWEKRA
ncbi:MAG TPA: hypothetical protein DCR05_04635 [Alphaproteobacteria bacterium]|nr:hypothetical protein [Alphaproteobacteria bacterium]